jgi:hypothetical protein
MLAPISSSSRQSISPDTVLMLKHTTVTILGLWVGIVRSDAKEVGFSIAEPKCVAALPSICALVRAALCVLPTKKSSVDRMAPDIIVLGKCMAVANFASGHLHMQVGTCVHAGQVCEFWRVRACQHSNQSHGQTALVSCLLTPQQTHWVCTQSHLPVLLTTPPCTAPCTTVLQGFWEPCT